MAEAQVEKPMKKAPRVTMPTEAAGVPVGSDKYCVDVDAKKKEKTNVAVKVPKPKADSTTCLHWMGYCVKGCDCDVCVAKRKEPNKTAMHNSKRVPKEPPN